MSIIVSYACESACGRERGFGQRQLAGCFSFAETGAGRCRKTLAKTA
jgi:hypothetical protein